MEVDSFKLYPMLASSRFCFCLSADDRLTSCKQQHQPKPNTKQTKTTKNKNKQPTTKSHQRQTKTHNKHNNNCLTPNASFQHQAHIHIQEENVPDGAN
jgi:hypothetical protein